MQSTGQASTQAVSFVPMQGSAMTYVMNHLHRLSRYAFRKMNSTSLRGKLGTIIAENCQGQVTDFALLDRGFFGSCGSQILKNRSEEHTSELQSRQYLVCRLLLEKKKKKRID